MARALQPKRLRDLAWRRALAQELLRPSNFLSKQICIHLSECLSELIQLFVCEGKQTDSRRGVAARQVDAGGRDLDERLEEDLLVALRFHPERFPLLVRLEEAPRAKLFQAVREERIGGIDQPRPPEMRPSFSRNASTGQ